MKLLAVVKNPVSIARYLAAASELTEVPGCSPPRTPPYWKSQVLRRQALSDETWGAHPAEATRQRKKRQRKRGCTARGRSPRAAVWHVGGPLEAAPDAPRPPEVVGIDGQTALVSGYGRVR